MTRLWTAGIAVVVLTAAACSEPQSPQQPGGTEPAAHGSLAECLKAHGVPEASSRAVVSGPPAGVDPGTWNQAMKACSTLAPGPAGP